jgi:hypothetical protein
MVKSLIIDENANLTLNRILSEYKPSNSNDSPLQNSSKTGLIIGTVNFINNFIFGS